MNLSSSCSYAFQLAYNVEHRAFRIEIYLIKNTPTSSLIRPIFHLITFLNIQVFKRRPLINDKLRDFIRHELAIIPEAKPRHAQGRHGKVPDRETILLWVEIHEQLQHWKENRDETAAIPEAMTWRALQKFWVRLKECTVHEGKQLDDIIFKTK